MKRRLNIGLVIDDLNNHFTNEACRGAEIAARAIEANLFIIPGHYLGLTDSRYETMEYEYQYNTMFNLPNEEMVDIIFVLMGTIGSRASKALQLEFLQKLPNVPIVCLFTHVEGYHSVIFDNESGIDSLCEHFNRHGYKKYGYVTGPLTNKDANERLDAFKNMMAKFGNTVEEKQISEGDFTDGCHKSIRRLLDDNPDLEVVLFGNDRMALCGYEVFKERGLTPGVDIFAGGFDDDNFTSTMEPPLTTVKANSAELAYQAVLQADKFMKTKEPMCIRVETSLVQRNSCGCNGPDVEGLRNELHLDKIAEGSDECIDITINYLFGIYEDQGHIVEVKAAGKDFIKTYIDYIRDDSVTSIDDVSAKYDSFISTRVVEYINYERFVNTLSALHFEGICESEDITKRAWINKMFSDFYRRLSIEGLALRDTEASRRDAIIRLVNIQTGELYIMSEHDDIHYEHLVEGFNTVGFKGAFIYMFQGNTQNKLGLDWKAPKTCLLKSYIGETGSAVALPEEQQLIRTERIFNNEYSETSDRRTMTVFPLFVGEDLYGLMVANLDTGNLVNVTPIAYQLSVTLKSLFMIENQNKAKKELQSSLEQFMRDNSLLNKVAKTDELTGLFNRRGFLEYTQKLISDSLNYNRKAVICYADMDNLKMVNDVYGHDEGDFSLKLIAKALNISFRSTDIIGRLGGDEFVAFAIIDGNFSGEKIKEKIQKVLAHENEGIDKPYPVEMSIGIVEFNCSPDCDIYNLLDEADTMLYKEKRARKEANGSYR